MTHPDDKPRMDTGRIRARIRRIIDMARDLDAAAQEAYIEGQARGIWQECMPQAMEEARARCQGAAPGGPPETMAQPTRPSTSQHEVTSEANHGAWEDYIVWQKGGAYYIADVAAGEDGIGPFPTGSDAERALAGLQGRLPG